MRGLQVHCHAELWHGEGHLVQVDVGQVPAGPAVHFDGKDRPDPAMVVAEVDITVAHGLNENTYRRSRAGGGPEVAVYPPLYVRVQYVGALNSGNPGCPVFGGTHTHTFSEAAHAALTMEFRSPGSVLCGGILGQLNCDLERRPQLPNLIQLVDDWPMSDR
jgi:hypothetical protein